MATDLEKRFSEHFPEVQEGDLLTVPMVVERFDVFADRIEALEAENARLREALEWFESQRAAALDRSSMQVKEDPAVLALCLQHGFGAVMDSASRQWVRRDSKGAFFVGGCVGDTSARAALKQEGGE